MCAILLQLPLTDYNRMDRFLLAKNKSWEVVGLPNIEVKCSVSNCYFYKEGNNCGAPAIMIEVDKHALSEEEFSNELGIQIEHIDQADSSKNTCCRTFRPRNHRKNA